MNDRVEVTAPGMKRDLVIVRVVRASREIWAVCVSETVGMQRCMNAESRGNKVIWQVNLRGQHTVGVKANPGRHGGTWVRLFPLSLQVSKGHLLIRISVSPSVITSSKTYLICWFWDLNGIIHRKLKYSAWVLAHNSKMAIFVAVISAGFLHVSHEATHSDSMVRDSNYVEFYSRRTKGTI
jgi:hypothetical protein